MQAQRSSVGVSGGYTSNGFGAMVEYNHFWKEKNSINSSVYYSLASIDQGTETLDYNNITLNVGYYRRLINFEDGRFTNEIGGGGVIGYEILNDGKEELDTGAVIEGESQVIYGAYIGTNFNYFISDFFTVSLVANQFYHVNSDLGNYATYVGLGIKYYVF
ncbi:conjugal transfer protein TraO [Tenacibaculum agarivorans]|uniref:conjugal transfer protein TraO n=1 Tax=Tenacibaculum agarivorans TaxID=1908389 RepID=UPI00094B9C20|nr:conjugal transfer protein TraO [Tenacibaculum agarivorans]